MRHHKGIEPSGAAGAAAFLAAREGAALWHSPAPPLQRAHGVARLSLTLRDGETVASEAYQEAGFRLRRPRVEPGLAPEIVLINTAGGVTGGDRFALSVKAGTGTAAVLTTQAAEKVYRSSGGFGQIDTTIAIEAGAQLDWLPQETILFDGGALERSLTVEMAPDARFIAVESLVFGRHARGETVTAGYVFDRWRVRRAGRLVYAEGLRFDGAVARALQARAAGGGATAAASLLMVSPQAEATLDAVRDRLAKDETVQAGASAFDGLLTVRLLASDAYALRRTLVGVLETLRGPLPRVWFC